MKKVTTIKQLNTILKDKKPHDFGLMLNGGLMSRKTIQHRQIGDLIYKFRYYKVTNHIDDTNQKLSKDQLFDQTITNIGRAMKKGAFYLLSD